MANLFLDELDEEMFRQGYKYLRFADDFVTLARKPDEARASLRLSKEVLEKLLLKLDYTANE